MNMKKYKINTKKIIELSKKIIINYYKFINR